MAKVQAVPQGFHTLTPSLTIKGSCAEAMEFYKKAFGAEEITRAPDPSGKKVWHGHMRIGDSMLFLNDEMPEMGGFAHPVKLWVYVENADGAFKRAIDAGCKQTMPMADQFWGDRTGTCEDKWGNSWTIAQHTKDLTPAEMKKAQDEAVAAMQKKR